MDNLDKYLIPTNAPISSGANVSSYQFDSQYDRSSVTSAKVKNYGLNFNSISGGITVIGSVSSGSWVTLGSILTFVSPTPSRVLFLYSAVPIVSLLDPGDSVGLWVAINVDGSILPSSSGFGIVFSQQLTSGTSGAIFSGNQMMTVQHVVPVKAGVHQFSVLGSISVVGTAAVTMNPQRFTYISFGN